MRWLIAVSAACLAACGSQDAGSKDPAHAADDAPAPTPPAAANRFPAAPDLTTCPARELLEEGLRQRTTPIAVPSVLRAVMRSGMDNFAVATLGGATLCVDSSWMEGLRDPALSADGRFASFGWEGYEAFGHVIVDRAGEGAVLDTGVPPVASPSGKLLAAADLSESGFGALNAFAVWRIEAAAVRELAMRDDVPPAYDWRIDGWAGETCVNLSSVQWESFTADSSGPRERFRARQENAWRVEPGRCAEA